MCIRRDGGSELEVHRLRFDCIIVRFGPSGFPRGHGIIVVAVIWRMRLDSVCVDLGFQPQRIRTQGVEDQSDVDVDVYVEFDVDVHFDLDADV